MKLSFRSSTWLLQVLSAPFVLVGIALVFTIIGVLVGIGIIVCVVLVWRTAMRARAVGADLATMTRFRNWALVITASLAIPLAIALVVGSDSVLDKPINIAGAAVAVGWTALAAWVAVAAARAVHGVDGFSQSLGAQPRR